MDSNVGPLAQSHAPLPLIWEVLNLDPDEDLRLVVVAAKTVDDRCEAAIRDLTASGENVAVVVLYSGSDPEEEVRALEAGADDCIPVPFDLRVLWVRLRATAARLRRSNTYRSQPEHTVDVNPITHQARVDGRVLSLSPLEFRFLLELQRQRGRVVPHERLEKLLWGTGGASSRQSLKQVVHRLRARLGDCRDAITAVAGVGYMLK